MIIMMAIFGSIMLGFIAFAGLKSYQWMKRKEDSGDLSFHFVLAPSLLLLGCIATLCYVATESIPIKEISLAAQFGFYFFGFMSAIVALGYKLKTSESGRRRC